MVSIPQSEAPSIPLCRCEQVACVSPWVWVCAKCYSRAETPQCQSHPQSDTIRVLAAYGLDDTLKLDRDRTFVKSIFLLQIVHPDDLDVPEDTIIHDLELTDVRALHPTQPSPSPLPTQS